MARTTVNSGQVRDSDIRRDDLHVSADGTKSVLTRLIDVANSGVKIQSSTIPGTASAAYAGTGDVALQLDWTYLNTIYAAKVHTHYIADIVDFPSQTGNAGYYLTTNGTTLSWAAVSSGGTAFTEVRFKVGDTGFPGDADTTYTNSSFVGKTIDVFREGELQYVNDTVTGYQFDSATGIITFYPELSTPERIVIHVYNVDTSSLGYVFNRSVTLTGSIVELVNDVQNPGVSMYYGTDVNGIKGWYDLTAVTGGSSGSAGAPDIEVKFKVGDVGKPQDNDSTYVDSQFVGRNVKVYREGDRQYLGATYGFDFDSTTGTFTFYPSLSAGEQIIIESYTIYGAANSIQQTSGTITLVNDQANPGNSKYYGTNALGVKGWYSMGALGSSVAWGAITGTITDQTDLMTYLNAKVPGTRTLTINGVAYDLTADRSWTIAGGGSTYTFTNGLTESSGTVSLGGALTGLTTITQSSNIFQVQNTTGNFTMRLNPASGIYQFGDISSALSNTSLKVDATAGKVTVYNKFNLASYGTGANTGTGAYALLIDASGNVIEGSIAGAGESPLTFNNGLTRTTNTITLGGALNADTTITGASTYNFEISSLFSLYLATSPDAGSWYSDLGLGFNNPYLENIKSGANNYAGVYAYSNQVYLQANGITASQPNTVMVEDIGITITPFSTSIPFKVVNLPTAASTDDIVMITSGNIVKRIASSTFLTASGASSAYQPLDSDLTAIAALTGTSGFLKTNGAGTWSVDTSTYLTTASASSTYQPLDSDLTAIAALTGTSGFLKTNGSGTWSVDTSTYALSSAVPTAANPTASVGLTAVNGSASTYMRSDAAPSLSQAIAPTWTGQHQWTVARTVASAAGAVLDDVVINASTTTVTGTTGIATAKGFNKVSIYQPTITDSSAVTITNAATFYIDNAPVASGSATITNAYALWVGSGNSKFGGTVTASSLIKSGGTASQFLKADGSVDSSTYLTANQSISLSNDASGSGTTTISTTITGLRGVVLPTLGATAGLLKYTGTGTNTWVFDTNTYLTANQSITLSGDVSGTGTTAITTAIGTNKVTNTMLAQMTANTIKGNNTAGLANAADLTGTQVTAMLDVFTSALKGLTPASGGGTTNYLRADGTWAAPPGTLTAANPTATIGLTAVNGSATTYMRSDAAPALDQTIAPTWSGAHTHTVARTIASAAGAVLDDIKVSAATTTISGATNITTSTGFNKVSFMQPTYSGTVTITNAATLYIDNAPTITGGGAITSAYALWVNTGTTRLGGNLSAGGNISLSASNAIISFSNGIYLSSGVTTANLTVNGSTAQTYHHTKLDNAATTASANNNIAQQIFLSTGAYTTASSGTHTIAAQTVLKPLTLTANATTPASVTNAATLLIDGVASGTATITNNYAIWVTGGNSLFAGNITASSIIKSGGTAAQFLKADGSVDSNTYLTTSSASSSYQPLDSDLTAIAGLTGTSGFLKTNGSGTWSVDTSTYATTASLPTGANPTATIGLTAVNGSATTFLRSDGAPALSQAIAPTWTGQHQWTVARTIASGAAAVLDDIAINASTTTITGTTGIATIKGFNKVSIYQPTYTDGSAVTITNAATLYIDNAPAAAGSVTITNAYALWVAAGNSKFGGTVTASSLIKSGGTSAQFLKADGSVDSSTYLTANQSISLSTDASGSGTTAISVTVTGLRGVALPTLGATAGLLKYTGTGTNTWVFDTNTYLTANQTITLSGDVSGSGTTAITTAIGANKVTNAMLGQMGANTIKGNNTGGTANAADLTATQVTAMLNLFTSTLQGLVPASGGGTTTFLRADGTWADPAAAGGGMSNPMTTLGDMIYENATPTPARLAGNTTTTKKYLTQTGDGVNSAAPGWNTIAMADLGTGTTDNTTVLGGDGTWHPNTRSHGIGFASPGASENMTIWKAGTAITVTSVDIVILGSTPSVTYTINYGTNRSSATGTIVASNTVTASGSATVNTSSIPSGSYIWVTTSASSGTINEFSIQINYLQ